MSINYLTLSYDSKLQPAKKFMKIGNYDNLKSLGSRVETPKSPNDNILEVVNNPYPDLNYVARFSTKEFTSLCPVTGQPDFANVIIEYIPNKKIVESKSLKLFFQSFRNHNDFHEACTIFIAKKIIEISEPKWLRIRTYWTPRGGIPIDVFYQTGKPPEGVYIDESKPFSGY